MTDSITDSAGVPPESAPTEQDEELNRQVRAFGRPVLKVVLIILAIFGLLIPLFLVLDVIHERQSRYQAVVAEVGRLWGEAQRLDGPVLVVPYRVTTRNRDGQTVTYDRSAFFLPDRYTVRAAATPEIRRRGIFDTVVYSVNLTVEGTFVLPEPASWLPADSEIQWNGVRLVAGVSDPRSIREGVSVSWRGAELPLRPGTHAELARWMTAGMYAELPGMREAPAGQPLPFSLTLRLNGSETLNFLPIGRENRVEVSSSWPDPSFIGAFLPESREVSPDGFTARWAVSYFGRSYPQQWTTDSAPDTLSYAIRDSTFGVRFFQPVNSYHQAERSAKYGILFLVFTFIVFFLFEVGAGLRIHIFQYGLVGLSLCLFYLLLVSFAEQVGFGAAYLIGAIAIVLQICAYSFRAVGGWHRTLVLGGLLGGLYAALYILMQLEDMALLVGSVGLFLALSAVMWFTRRIDWYAVQRPVAAVVAPRTPRTEPTAPSPEI